MNQFEVEKNQKLGDESAAQQLSLLDLEFQNEKMKLDFGEVNSNENSNHFNYELWKNSLATAEGAEREPKYFAVSALLHALFALATLFIALPQRDKLETNTITVELEEPTPELIQKIKLNQGQETPATSGHHSPEPNPTPSTSTKTQAPLVAQTSEDQIVIPTKTALRSKAVMSTAKTHTSGGRAKIATTAPSRAGVPESLEDIAAPQLDADGVEFSQVGKLGEDEFEDDFKNIDAKTVAAVKSAKNQMDDELKQIADEKDQALKAEQDENQKFANRIHEANRAQRMKEAEAIAAAQANERATAERAARAEAERQARLKALTEAARQKASGTGQAQQGAGAGNNGLNQTGAVAGAPNGIRSLDQLRQMPGNPRPSYSTEERLLRHQGEIILYAYVSKQGDLSKFKMIQSTNYRNLDAKTLAALKKWKFYPGQEGWVELPFKWDLKGGVQEVPTTLRRRL